MKIGLERNRVYGTPMPEIEAAAARAGVKIHLRSAPIDDEEQEEGAELTSCGEGTRRLDSSKDQGQASR